MDGLSESTKSVEQNEGFVKHVLNLMILPKKNYLI